MENPGRKINKHSSIKFLQFCIQNSFEKKEIPSFLTTKRNLSPKVLFLLFNFFMFNGKIYEKILKNI